jgi:hypothetical protein
MLAFKSEVHNRKGVDTYVLTDKMVDICVSLGLSMGGGGNETIGRYYITDTKKRSLSDLEEIRDQYQASILQLDGVTKVKCSTIEKA